MNNKILIIIMLIFIFSCKKQKSEIESILTNDSISMWDRTEYEMDTLEDGSLKERIYIRSVSFQTNGSCNFFRRMRDGSQRYIVIRGPEPDFYGVCNRYELLNDSTIKMFCKYSFSIKIISRDTLHLLDSLGNKVHDLYRVPPPWNIYKESIEERNREVRSGKYKESYFIY